MLTCPVCFNSTARVLRQDSVHQGNFFMVCGCCGHGYCSKPFADQPDTPETLNQNAFYGPEGAPLSEYGQLLANTHKPSADYFCKRFRNYSSGKAFLEIGCGPGTFLKYASQHTDFLLHGNEISPKASQYTREILKIPVTDKAFTKELYLPQTFDMVFLSHVIEHIPDVQTLVRDIHAICNPGAIVGIACPNHHSLTAGLKRRIFYPLRKTAEYGHLHWPLHLHGFSPSSLQWLMKQAGFSPVEVATWSRVQRVYPQSLLSADSILLPVFIAEYLLGRGNLITAFFRKHG